MGAWRKDAGCSRFVTIWRDLWRTSDAPHLFWGETTGVSWVAHYSPVTAGPGLRYTIVLNGDGGHHLCIFDKRPSLEEVQVAVADWLRFRCLHRA